MGGPAGGNAGGLPAAATNAEWQEAEASDLQPTHPSPSEAMDAASCGDRGASGSRATRLRAQKRRQQLARLKAQDCQAADSQGDRHDQTCPVAHKSVQTCPEKNSFRCEKEVQTDPRLSTPAPSCTDWNGRVGNLLTRLRADSDEGVEAQVGADFGENASYEGESDYDSDEASFESNDFLDDEGAAREADAFFQRF